MRLYQRRKVKKEKKNFLELDLRWQKAKNSYDYVFSLLKGKIYNSLSQRRAKANQIREKSYSKSFCVHICVRSFLLGYGKRKLLTLKRV